MKRICLTLLCQLAVCFTALSARALSDEYITGSNRVERLGWVNVDEDGRIANKVITPEYLNERITVVLRWCYACPGISESIPAFERLSDNFNGRDVEFIHSYYPGQRHAKSLVLKFVEKFAITNAVYSGAAPAEAGFRDMHRSVAVVLPGGKVVWSVSYNTLTNVKELETVLKENLNSWRRTSIETLWEENPAAAYEWSQKALTFEIPEEDREYYSNPDTHEIQSALAYIAVLRRLSQKNLLPAEAAFFKKLIASYQQPSAVKAKIKEFMKLQEEYEALVNQSAGAKQNRAKFNAKKTAIANKLKSLLKHKSFPYELNDSAKELLKSLEAK